MYFPYIGVTDLTTAEQVQTALATFKTFLPPWSAYRLQINAIMTRKTFTGAVGKYPFPKKEMLPTIFSSTETMNCLHYTDYVIKMGLRNILADAIYACGENIHAVQLDMTWPSPEKIRKGIEDSKKKLEVILQIGSDALTECSYKPEKVVERLKKYDGIISHVVLDKSKVEEKALDANALLPFAAALRAAFPALGITVSGGIGPHTTNLAIPFVEQFAGMSMSAQAQLHNNEDLTQPIELDRVSTFLQEAIRLLH